MGTWITSQSQYLYTSNSDPINTPAARCFIAVVTHRAFVESGPRSPSVNDLLRYDPETVNRHGSVTKNRGPMGRKRGGAQRGLKAGTLVARAGLTSYENIELRLQMSICLIVVTKLGRRRTKGVCVCSDFSLLENRQLLTPKTTAKCKQKTSIFLLFSFRYNFADFKNNRCARERPSALVRACCRTICPDSCGHAQGKPQICSLLAKKHDEQCDCDRCGGASNASFNNKNKNKLCGLQSASELYRLSDRNLFAKFSANFCG
jgi:hypothetical protein